MTLTAPNKTGLYPYFATFNGDATYSTIASSQDVQVGEMSNLVMAPIKTQAQEIFYAEAKLTNKYSQPIEGAIVTFTFTSVGGLEIEAYGQTNSAGVAKGSFTAPSSTGTFSMLAEFPGDNQYASAAAETTVLVSQRTTLMLAFPQPSAVAGLETVIQAQLIDTTNGASAPMVDKTISFYFEGSTITALSDSGGIAYTTITAPVASGDYYFTAKYDGDVVYQTSQSQGKVTVGRRTSMLFVSPVSEYAGSVFTAEAKLFIPVGVGIAIPDKEVRFTYNGIVSTGTTGADGIAKATFTSLGVVGSTNIYTAFAGDVQYSSSTSQALVTTKLRPTFITAENATVRANTVFLVTATVSDVLSGTSIPGSTVTFSFLGSSKTAVSNGIGVATVTYASTFDIGQTTYTASVSTTATYEAYVATATVDTIRRRTSIAGSGVEVLAKAGFTAMVTLTDELGSYPLNGETLTFEFQSTTKTAVTDALGVASVTFTAPVATSTYQLPVSFAGNALNDTATNSFPIKVNPRVLMMTMQDVITNVNSVFLTTVTLIDAGTGEAVVGATVTYTFRATTYTALSDSYGQAVGSIPAGTILGTSTIRVDFNGNNTYAASSVTAVVDALLRPVELITLATTAVAGSSFTVQLSAMDVLASTGIPGYVTTFTFMGSTRTVTTDSNGFSTAEFTAPAATGAFTVNMSLAGAGVYVSGSTATIVTVTGRPTAIVAQSTGAYVSSSTVLMASLYDVNNATSVAGGLLQFSFAGHTMTAITDSSGTAKLTFNTPQSSGAYAYQVHFPATSEFLSSDDEAQVNIKFYETAINTTDILAEKSALFISSAVLLDAVNMFPLANQNVTFAFQGDTVTVRTDGVGMATAAFVSPVATGAYSLYIAYAGQEPYQSAATTATITVGGTGGTDVQFVLFANNAIYDQIFTANSTGTFIMSALFEGTTIYRAATSSATLTIDRRPTRFNMNVATPKYSTVFKTTATLVDALTGTPLTFRNVEFYFLGSTATTTTGADGVGYGQFLAPVATMTYNYYAYYAGDGLYGPNTSTGSVVVSENGGGGGGSGTSPVMLLASTITAVTNEPFIASATLTDTKTGFAITASSITFTFQSVSVLGWTNSVGLATVSFTAPLTEQTTTFFAYYMGNSTYTAAVSTGVVNVGLGWIPKDPVMIRATQVTTVTFTLGWDAVTTSVGGQSMPARISAYRLEKAVVVENKWLSVATIPASVPLTYTVTASTVADVYRVRVVTIDGFFSAGLTAVRVQALAQQTTEETKQVPSVVYMSSDLNAWVEIEETAYNQVAPSQDMTFVLTDIESSVSPQGFLSGYEMKAQLGGVDAPNLEFDRVKPMKIVLSHKRLQETQRLQAVSASQLAVYWFNGVEWVKLGGVTNSIDGRSYVYFRRLGRFALKLDTLAGEFKFTKVAPRIFTPEETLDAANKSRFYYENPNFDEVTIRIFDITGAQIRSNLSSDGTNVQYWDGKDSSGKYAKAGVYIYQIEAGGKVQTGTIVIAK